MGIKLFPTVFIRPDLKRNNAARLILDAQRISERISISTDHLAKPYFTANLICGEKIATRSFFETVAHFPIPKKDRGINSEEKFVALNFYIISSQVYLMMRALTSETSTGEEVREAIIANLNALIDDGFVPSQTNLLIYTLAGREKMKEAENSTRQFIHAGEILGKPQLPVDVLLSFQFSHALFGLECAGRAGVETHSKLFDNPQVHEYMAPAYLFAHALLGSDGIEKAYESINSYNEHQELPKIDRLQDHFPYIKPAFLIAYAIAQKIEEGN